MVGVIHIPRDAAKLEQRLKGTDMFTSMDELERGLSDIKSSPKETGAVELIVRRPETGEREVLEQAELDSTHGMVGDNWLTRSDGKGRRATANPDMQINLMNSRSISVIAQTRDRWPLAGDQFYVDLDLSAENLPAGTVLEIGTARLEVTSEPHLGCKKFKERFGKDAVLFVNSDEGKALNLRGINARVTVAGVVKSGDTIRKVD